MEVVLVRSKNPRGVLMVFHGCMRRPTDWWHYEPTCVTCIGEPGFMTDTSHPCAFSVPLFAMMRSQKVTVIMLRNERDWVRGCAIAGTVLRKVLICTGMPEELSIAKAALARSFDVLALTPKEKVYRCWDTEWPDQSEDIPRVHALPISLHRISYFSQSYPL